MSGYFHMPEATLEAQAGLWFHTGDRGYLDEDGYLYFVERSNEAIRRRGENISANEVERILCRHECVIEVAAVAVPSDMSEDEVMVYVVRKGHRPITYEELVEFAAENMAKFMVPRYWKFVKELPKTPSEKVEKYKLKMLATKELSLLWDRERTTDLGRLPWKAFRGAAALAISTARRPEEAHGEG